jgi:hypothetical protein
LASQATMLVSKSAFVRAKTSLIPSSSLGDRDSDKLGARALKRKAQLKINPALVT